MINWHDIDTVLLDMDGTLLDLHFDNFFWTQHLPRRYVETHGGELADVTTRLIDRIMSQRGSLNWYCLDYWSAELNLDITALKREISHLIGPLPGALAFLEALNASHCSTWLVTNAHRGGLDLKLQQTGIDQWLQRVISSHDFALPKENPEFWQRLGQKWPFDPDRTLLIDDTHSVLASAQAFGIRHLLTIAQPDSQQGQRQGLQFPAVNQLGDILPIPERPTL